MLDQALYDKIALDHLPMCHTRTLSDCTSHSDSSDYQYNFYTWDKQPKHRIKPRNKQEILSYHQARFSDVGCFRKDLKGLL